MLKYKEYKVIDVDDWDNLVQETYGKPYSFQQQDGCKSRGVEYISIPDLDDEEIYKDEKIPEIINGDERGVNFKTWLERDPNNPLNPSSEELKNSNYYWGKTEEDEEKYKNDKFNIELFWERSFYPHIQMIANDLYEKGLIEKGEYIIDIDW